MDIESPETLIRCLKIRRHFYIEVHDSATRYLKEYHCMLCDEAMLDVNSLVDHLKSEDHKKMLNLAKLTLLKRNINRWPFNDGVLLFDSSIQEEEMSYFERKNAFKDDSEGFKTFQECLRAIDNDDKLSIEPFEYDPDILNPRVKAYSGVFLIHAHGDTLKIGKSQIFGRYDSDGRIDKLWSEWIGKDDNDLTCNEVEDPDNGLIRVVIMRYMHWMANRFCGICNREKLVGRDVASLHEPPVSSFANILCCTYTNIRARNNGRSGDLASQMKRFHTFHTSCLIHWILWCEYAQWVKIEGINDIDNLFCPDCNTTDVNGREYPDKKSEMDRVKSMILQAKNEWTENPERLQNSSIGLYFPLQSEDTKKDVKFLKLIQYYRAEYEIPDYPTRVESMN